MTMLASRGHQWTSLAGVSEAANVVKFKHGPKTRKARDDSVFRPSALSRPCCVCMSTTAAGAASVPMSAEYPG